MFTRARLTTCTALALSAGMLLASPAVADAGSRPPRPVVADPLREAGAPPRLDLSPLAGPAGTARTAEAAAVVPSRFDVDGDGQTDLLHRDWNGRTIIASSSGVTTELITDGSVLDLDLVPLGDQDGSGKPEVLSLSADGVLRLYSETTVTSASPTWSGKGWNMYNKVFSPGDVDGDGKNDLLARQYNGELYLYRWTGGATEPFAGRVRVGAGWGVYDQLVGIGDNDGDGKGDAVARSTDGKLYFYGSTGDTAAPFKPRKEVGTGWQIYNQLLSSDDINGDGNADLLARDQSGALWGYSGRGDGTFATRLKLGGTWNNVDQFAAAGNVPAAGKTAFLARAKSGYLFWYGSLNNGNITAREQVGTSDNWGGASISFVSALDGGPFADLLEIYQGHLYNADRDLGAGWQIYNLLVGPGDLSGDGKADLLARDASGVMWLYRGNGLGTGVASRIKIGAGWGAYNRTLGAGDFSGDGRADLVVRDGSGNLWLYKGTGVATAPFAARVKIGTGWGIYDKLVAPGDLNGDGKADLLAVNPAGDLYRYLGTGTGSAITARVKIGYGYQIYNTLY